MLCYDYVKNYVKKYVKNYVKWWDYEWIQSNLSHQIKMLGMGINIVPSM